jgi:hypothetical protein
MASRKVTFYLDDQDPIQAEILNWLESLEENEEKGKRTYRSRAISFNIIIALSKYVKALIRKSKDTGAVRAPRKQKLVEVQPSPKNSLSEPIKTRPEEAVVNDNDKMDTSIELPQISSRLSAALKKMSFD